MTPLRFSVHCGGSFACWGSSLKGTRGVELAGRILVAVSPSGTCVLWIRRDWASSSPFAVQHPKSLSPIIHLPEQTLSMLNAASIFRGPRPRPPRYGDYKALSLSLSFSREESSEETPCFFVLCKRHWFNRVPGAHRGDSLHLPLALTRTLAMPSYF